MAKIHYLMTSVLCTILLQASLGVCNCGSHLDMCACRQNRDCVFRDNKCQSTADGCKAFKLSGNECRRKGGIYGVGGALCVIPKEKVGDGPTKCRVISTALAVNLNGYEYEDFEGVVYQPGRDVTFDDPAGIAEKGRIETVHECLPEDVPMYNTFLRSKVQYDLGGQCVRFWVPIKNPGEYEITFRMVDPTSTKPYQRSFSAKFNNLTVISEMDMFSWTKKRALAMSVRVLFCVTGNNFLIVKGHNGSSAIKDGKVPLSFCSGSCDVIDPNFIISSFRIIQTSNINGACQNRIENDEIVVPKKSPGKPIGSTRKPVQKGGGGASGPPTKKPEDAKVGSGGNKTPTKKTVATKKPTQTKAEYDLDSDEELVYYKKYPRKPTPKRKPKKRG